jgi:hypothetical protein
MIWVVKDTMVKIDDQHNTLYYDDCTVFGERMMIIVRRRVESNIVVVAVHIREHTFPNTAAVYDVAVDRERQPIM